MGYLSKRKFEERERYMVSGLLILIPVLTLLGTLGRSLDWRLDYLGEFKIQATCLSFALFIWCLAKQEWIKMITFLVLAIMNIALIATHAHLTQKESQLPEDSYVFTMLYQNLKGAETNVAQVQKVMNETEADFVLWTNVPVELYRHLDNLIGPYQLQNQTHDKTGAMKLILARTPGVDRGEAAEAAGLWVSRVIGTRKLTLLLTYFDSPWQKEKYEETKQKIFELSEFVRSRDEPVVVVGSFGASGWSWLLKDIETYAELQPQGTLLSSGTEKPFFSRRPTDHVYTHPGIEIAAIDAQNIIGTDYNAIMATFKIAPIRKEIEFFELQPTLPEEELLQPPT